MVSLAGTIQDNSLVLKEDSLNNYNGKEVILTILDGTVKKPRKKIDWDSYGYETERGQNADKYIEELRANDRF